VAGCRGPGRGPGPAGGRAPHPGAQDPFQDVSWIAAEALGKIGDPQAVEPLIAALKEGEKWLRQGAAWALGKIRDPRAIEPLVAALKDLKADVRKNAAWALGQFTGDRVAAALSEAVKDPNPAVQRAARQALDALKEKDPGKNGPPAPAQG